MSGSLLTASTVVEKLVTDVKASWCGLAATTANAFLQDTTTNFTRRRINRMLDTVGYYAVRSEAVTAQVGVTGAMKEVRYLTCPPHAANIEVDIVSNLKRLLEAANEYGTFSGDVDNVFIGHKIQVRCAFKLPATARLENTMYVDPTMEKAELGPRQREDGAALRVLARAIEAAEAAREATPWTERIQGAIFGATETCTNTCSDLVDSARDALFSACGAGKILIVDFTYDQRLYDEIAALVSRCDGRGDRLLQAYNPGKVGAIIAGRKKEMLGDGPLAIEGLTEVSSEDIEYITVCSKMIYHALHMSRTKSMTDCIQILDGRCAYSVLGPLDAEAAKVDALAAALEEDCERVDELIEDMRGGFEKGILPAIPATELTGDKYKEGIIVSVNEEEIHEWLSARGRDGEGTKVGAVVTGPNILGASPPLDTSSPHTFLSGFTRHLCKYEKGVDLGDVSYKLCVDKSTGKPPAREYYMVARDLAQADSKAFTRWAANKQFTAEEVESYSVGSYGLTTTEEYLADYQDDWLGFDQNGLFKDTDEKLNEMIWNEAMHRAGERARSAIDVSVHCKAGEQSSRARYISVPGLNGTESRHQVEVARATKLYEAFKKECLNHTGIKGLTKEGICKAVGEFLWNTPEDHRVYSLDKSANDRSWGPFHLEVVVEYHKHVVKAFMDAVLIPHARANNYNLNIKTTYFNLVVDAILAYLLSAIGTTACWNGIQTHIEVGVMTHQHFGNAGYNAWKEWRCKGVSAELDYEGCFCNGYEEPPTKLIGDPTIQTPVRFVNEGDDLLLSMKKLANMSYNEQLKAFSVAGNKATGANYTHTETPDNVQCGKKAIAEVTSRFFGIDPKETMVHAAVMVPKPVKNVQKLAQMSSSQFQYALLKHGETSTIAAVKDETMHRLIATKALSLAEWNSESPFVGAYCLHAALNSLKEAGDCSPLWQERSMEAKAALGNANVLEEIQLPAEDTLRKWYQRLYDQIAGRRPSELQQFVAAMAWKIENPCIDLSILELRAALACAHLEFCDARTMPEEFIHDPAAVYREYETLWFLGPVVRKNYTGLYDTLNKAKYLTREHQDYDTILADIKKVTVGRQVLANKKVKAAAANADPNGRRDVLNLKSEAPTRISEPAKPEGADSAAQEGESQSATEQPPARPRRNAAAAHKASGQAQTGPKHNASAKAKKGQGPGRGSKASAVAARNRSL